MAKGTEALVEAAVLRWARESIGMDLDQAAQRIGIDEQRLQAWETGAAKPTIAQLRKAAIAYKRPLAVFYLAEPPRGFQPMKDFRRLPGEEGRASPSLIWEVRKALSRREVALDLSELLHEDVPEFSLRISLSDDTSELAAILRRDVLGITVEQQLEWKDDYEAFRAWRVAVEKLGVLVFQVTLDVDEMRGAAAAHAKFPVLLVNSKDAPTARCFSVLHELGHLGLAQGSVCDFQDQDRAEVFCNRLAAEILVPADELRRQIAGLRYQREWPEDEIRTLARRFRVSGDVVTLRLVAIDRASAAFYKSRRERLASLGPPVTSGGPVKFFRRVVSNAGLPYLRLVLGAYREEAITASELSDYLGAKLRHVPDIEQAVFGGVLEPADS